MSEAGEVVAPAAAPSQPVPAVEPVAAPPAVQPPQPTSAAEALTGEAPPVAPVVTPPGWTSDFSEDLQGLAEVKGWKSAEDALRAYQSAETLIGTDPAQTVKIPTDPAAEEWGKPGGIWDRMGRPSDPTGYEFNEVPEHLNDMSEAFRPIAHEVGLSKAQSQKLADWMTKTTQANEAAEDAAVAAQSQQDLVLLQSEWGSEYEANIQTAKSAALQFLPKDQLSQIEEAIGTGELLKMALNIGKGMGEHQIVDTSDPVSGGGYSPAGAKSKIAALMADPDYKARYLKGGQKELKEVWSLQQIASPGEQTGSISLGEG